MRVTRSYTSSSKSILITMIMTLLISACSAEDPAAADGNPDTNNINNPYDTNETNTNQKAIISGRNTGKVTEDLDSNNDGLLGASGKLNISDSDYGEAAFVAETIYSDYGSVTIDAAGNWFYGAVKSLAIIQMLTSKDTRTDQLIVRSIDGTTHTIVITIYGVDETFVSGGTGGGSGGGTNGNTSGNGSTTTDPGNTTPPPATNNAAIIGGTDTGSVTEDVDPDGDNLLEVSGKLSISDIDTGEATFITKTIISNYGNLTINAAGNWNYSADNSQSSIQNLNNTDTLTERLSINSVDGTTHVIVITIIGADETNAPGNNITLSWVAPAQRTDNKPIALSEIAGYKIYYGSAQGNYNNSIDIADSAATGYTFTSLPAGTYYFVITTRDVGGRESQYSTEVTIAI